MEEYHKIYKDLTPLERIQTCWEIFFLRVPETMTVWDGLVGKIRWIAASVEPRPTAVCEFTVERMHCNAFGSMHGGAISTLFDQVTSLGISTISTPKFWLFPGVTRTLNVTCILGIPMGTTVYVRTEVTSISKRMAVLKGELTDKEGKIIYATCEHGKVNIDDKWSALSRI